MANSFSVNVIDFSNLLEIEGARNEKDFSLLLEAMEYGDLTGMSADERREMCILSLQDLKPTEAAYIVLKHDMSDVIRDGQERNISVEMLDEKL
jgi:hypothetical protein